MAELKRTPLYPAHVRAGAKLVDFAGFEMPVQYRSVLEEHEAVRQRAGLFDVSHMGEIVFDGPSALRAVQRLVTNDLAACADGQAMYAAICNEHGGIVDDVVVYRRSATNFLVCVNASNRDKDFAWFREHTPGLSGLSLRDEGDAWAQLALQGPKAAGILTRLTPANLVGLGNYRFTVGNVADRTCLIARTGYTGEDGFELFCKPEDAVHLWDALLEAGAPETLIPCGLGARNSLRTEMKYCLYGNDIDDDTTPLEAGLGWIVKLVEGGGLRRTRSAGKAEGGRNPPQTRRLHPHRQGHTAPRLPGPDRRDEGVRGAQRNPVAHPEDPRWSLLLTDRASGDRAAILGGDQGPSRWSESGSNSLLQAADCVHGLAPYFVVGFCESQPLERGRNDQVDPHSRDPGGLLRAVRLCLLWRHRSGRPRGQLGAHRRDRRRGYRWNDRTHGRDWARWNERSDGRCGFKRHQRCDGPRRPRRPDRTRWRDRPSRSRRNPGERTAALTLAPGATPMPAAGVPSEPPVPPEQQALPVPPAQPERRARLEPPVLRARPVPTARPAQPVPPAQPASRVSP